MSQRVPGPVPDLQGEGHGGGGEGGGDPASAGGGGRGGRREAHGGQGGALESEMCLNNYLAFLGGRFLCGQE